MADRYEPLPGVLELPGWLYRRLSRQGKLVAGVLIGIGVAGLAVAALVLIPMISESKREDRARERREAAQARRERVALLTRQQRPLSGRLSTVATAGAVAELQRRVLADATARVRSGELDTPVKRVDCRRLDGTRDVILACEAVTSDIPGGEVSRGGRIGYPYRARLRLDRGRYAFCRVAGRPGEGSLGTGVHVPLSATSGG